ncbi:MAG: hypothetical protein ACYDIE_05180 [Candidatus Krumholzibacteriia bacterium]
MRTPVDEALPVGERAVAWDVKDAHRPLAASGTCIVPLVTGQGVMTNEITLAR